MADKCSHGRAVGCRAMDYMCDRPGPHVVVTLLYLPSYPTQESDIFSTSACCDAHPGPEVIQVGEILSWALTTLHTVLRVLLYIVLDTPAECSSTRARCNSNAL